MESDTTIDSVSVAISIVMMSIVIMNVVGIRCVEHLGFDMIDSCWMSSIVECGHV